MFLMHAKSKDLVEVLDLRSLFNANADKLVGRYHAGEELQDPEKFNKSDLLFPSGEALPKCWTDPKYR